MARKQRIAIADAINGNSSTSIVPSPVYVKCFATIRHSKTDPNVARVATMLNVMPITVDRSDDPDCAGGDGFLFFAFCLFVAICRSCWVGSFDLTRTLLRRFCSDRLTHHRTLGRRTA
jgi:hypothetical protein